MIEILKSIMLESWHILTDASLYILLGFFVAGILHVFISPERIVKYLGKDNMSSVLYASLLGIPVPLCSCGVVPTAISLRKNGAAKGPVISFLISTPESGVDSIAITYAMLDPIMTIFRPVSAFITATVAGAFANLFPEHNDSPENSADSCCKIKGCQFVETDNNHTHTMKEKFFSCIEYGFVDLLGDVSKWLIIGILIAGAVSYIIPINFFEQYVGSGFPSMIAALIIGIPLYMCATSSTPIAAALISKGLNPGAALVFLLSGPATNAATLTVIWKFIGKKGTLIYLSSIAFCSIALGFAVNYIYAWSGIIPMASTFQAGKLFPSWIETVASIILVILLCNGVWHEYKTEHGSCNSC